MNERMAERTCDDETNRQRAQLRHGHVSCDNLTRCGREQGAKCKHTSKPIIDWTFLLKLNPPPGYSPVKNSAGLTKIPNEKQNDQVITILRKILRDLDKNIREEKRQIRVCHFFLNIFSFLFIFVGNNNNNNNVFILRG